MTLPETLTTFTRKIDDIINSTIASAGLLASDIGSSLTQVQGDDLKFLLDPSVKKIIQEYIRQTLNNNSYCSGAGFASHIESSDENKEFWLLEWWYKKADGVKKVNLDLDQATQQRLDFRTFEWFKQAQEQGKAYIHGPYVDYVCNTSYTLTAAMPVYFNDRFLGVSAIDVLVSRVEEELLPYFNNNKVVLTNNEKRIIFSSYPKYRVGDLLNTQESTLLYQTDHVTVYQF